MGKVKTEEQEGPMAEPKSRYAGGRPPPPQLETTLPIESSFSKEKRKSRQIARPWKTVKGAQGAAKVGGGGWCRT